MMRKLVFAALGVCAAAMVVQPASAAVKTYWDEATRQWLKYDSNGVVGVGKRANYKAIPRKLVDYDGPFPPNTLVVNTAERRLYLIQPKGKAWKYGIGVGRDGFQWAGTDQISRKAEWPGWTPPPEMIKRERAKGRILPAFMEGGPNNPLGARALYIGSTMYRIHGSNEPWTIGGAVSSGCIRLTNDDVSDLYERVRVGTRVVVLQGNESPARLAALAKPPAPKPTTPDVKEARNKDDGSVVDTSSVGSTRPAEIPVSAAPAEVVTPTAAVATPAAAVVTPAAAVVIPPAAAETAIPASRNPAEAPVKDDAVTANTTVLGPTASN
jgi:lipoprotein-anchoring transpeptidase ErfK/SrfK